MIVKNIFKIKSKQINDFATEVRNQISAGTGISISNGEVSSTITQYTDALADARIKHVLANRS